MDRNTKWVAGGSLALAVIGGGTSNAIAAGAGDEDPNDEDPNDQDPNDQDGPRDD